MMHGLPILEALTLYLKTMMYCCGEALIATDSLPMSQVLHCHLSLTCNQLVKMHYFTCTEHKLHGCKFMAVCIHCSVAKDNEDDTLGNLGQHSDGQKFRPQCRECVKENKKPVPFGQKHQVGVCQATQVMQWQDMAAAAGDAAAAMGDMAAAMGDMTAAMGDVAAAMGDVTARPTPVPL